MKRFIRKIQKRNSTEQHQLKTSTSYNRYPEIFKVVATLPENSNPVKILSFGCSSGEECISQKEYFSDYEIVGVDVNPIVLDQARKNNSDINIKFLQSTDKNIAKYGPYDIIYCMSVLCKWPESKDLEDISGIYQFSDFEKRIEYLNQYLKPGGCLVLYNTNFRFSDCKLYQEYKTYALDIKDSGFVHKFDSNHKRLKTPYNEIIFIKGKN